MLFTENLKPLKIYRRPLFLPTVESDKKKKSAVFLLTPNYESSKGLMNSDLLINKLRFQSYYIEKDLTYFISSKVMNKVDDVTESYVRNFTESDFYHSLYEMSTAERNKLKDSDFGLPKKRKYPLHDRAHVKLAIKFFNHVDKEDEEELARNINKAIGKFFDSGELPSVGRNNRFSKYYKVSESYTEIGSYYQESYTNSFEDVKRIVNTLPKDELKLICNGSFKNSPYIVYREVLNIDNIPVAFIEIYNFNNSKSGIIVLACRYGTKYRQKGYTTDLLKRAINWAALNKDIDKLIYPVKTNNSKSINLAHKFGFSHPEEDTCPDEKIELELDVKHNVFISEAYIRNMEDIYYNKDKFDSGEINLCFITGHSGSGKSTMGRNMASDKVEHYELDDVVANFNFSDDNLKEYGDLIYSFFKSVGSKYRETKEELIKMEDYEKNIIRDFVEYSKKYAKNHKDRKFILEGIYLFFCIDPVSIDDFAVYIKGTSAVISAFRAAKRDYSESNNKIPEKIKWMIDRLITDIKNMKFFENKINEYRNYFGSRTKSVNEETRISNKDIPKHIYHLSDVNHDGEIFKPRNFDSMGIANGNERDVKRICFSDSINGALLSIFPQGATDAEMYVHIPDTDVKVYKTDKDDVYDSDVTHELWVKEPCRMKCIGKIKVIDMNTSKSRTIVDIKNLPYKKLKLFDFKWKWIEKFYDIETLYESFDNSQIIVSESSTKEYYIEKETGFYTPEGLYNSLVKVSGVDKQLRGRGEVLVLDSTLTKVYLVFKDNGKDYKVPGGGFEPNESHMDAAIREVKEEARLEVVGVYDTGVRYVEMFDKLDPWQESLLEKHKFYGFFTEVFVGTAIDTYDGDLATLDTDDKMTKGKFYDISEVWDKLTPEHKRALNFTVKESYILESSKGSKYKYERMSDKDIDEFYTCMERVFNEKSNMSRSDVRKSMKVIKSNGTVIGYIGFSEYNIDNKKYLGFGNFMILPEYQRSGYGTNIIADIVEKNKSKYDEIYCFVSKDNTKAINFYKKIAKVGDVLNKNNQYYVSIYSKTLLEESANLSNLTWYHLEPVRKGFNPKIAGGWDEELYSKNMEYAINNDIKSNYHCKGKDKIEAHVFTAGEELSPIYLGIITIYRHGDSFDWEWSEQQPISSSDISYLKDEVHPHLLDESVEYINTPDTATVTVSGLIFDNGKILLENHVKNNAYTVPGGKINPGESVEEAIVRELKEELGINVEEYKLFCVNTFDCEYPVGSGSYRWFKDYCFEIKRYSGVIENLEPRKHLDLKWMYFDDINENLPVAPLTLRIKERYDHITDQFNFYDAPVLVSDKDVTCSGYSDDIKILKYIATPEVYNDLLKVLEIRFGDIPKLNFIGCDREDLEILTTADGKKEINVLCYSRALDNISVEQYIRTALHIAIVGIIIANCPKSANTVFPRIIADLILGVTGYFSDYAKNLIKEYSLKGIFDMIENDQIRELFKAAKKYGIKEIESVDKLISVSESSTKITASNLADKIKYRTTTKVKVAGGKLKNTVSRLDDKIKDSIKIKTSTSATVNKSKSEEEVSESMLNALAEGSYIINGDYVTIFEDATYDPILKKILYKERMVKRSEVTLLHDRVKSDCPFIKYTYIDIDRYQGKNLFVDLYYYNEAFFKNNEWTLQRGFGLYKDFLDRLINDKRIKSAGYTRRTVFIPINDWNINPTTKMWLYRQDINPVSIIFEMMQRDPNGLSKLFKDVDVIFFAKDKYFKVDFTDIKGSKKNAIKFKTFVEKINKGEEFGQDDMDSTEDTPTKDAIKADIIDKIETSKGVDLTKAASEVKKNQNKNKGVEMSGLPVRTSTGKKDDSDDEKSTKSKASENKSIALDNSSSDKEIQKAIVKSIDRAIDGAADTDEALDNMDNDIDLKDLLSGLGKDDEININAARAERMTQLDRELLDKSIKGRTIRDILGDESGTTDHKEIPKTELSIASPNEEWKDMRYMNFDKTYDLEKDLVNIFKCFGDMSRPLSVRDIKVQDNSTSEDRLDLYTVDYEDYRGKRYTVKLDIPRIKNDRFMLRGNAKTIQTQFFNMPIIKTDLDTCQIVTNYKKIIISRYITTAGKSLPNTARFIKAANKCKGNKIKFTAGDNSRVCAKYVLPIDYIDLSSVFSIVETDEFIVYFNQDEIRNLYEVNDSLGVPYAYDKKNKQIVYYPNSCTTPFVDVLFGLLINDTKKYAEFFELYCSAKSPSRGMYSRARIMSSDIPLIVICAYSEGLTKVLKKANVQYRLVDKLTSVDRNDLTSDYIKFDDGYLIYTVDYSSSLLLNGLKDCNTLSHSITEIDDKNMYLEFLDEFGGRIKADGLDNFYDCEIDPITKETLSFYKLPTDYISVLLYANYLLSDNKFIRHTDTSSRRARRFELIAAYTYQVLSEAYGTYSNSLKHNRGAASFGCKQSAVIDKILLDSTSSDYSVINILNEVEATNAVTTKGLSGLNSDRAYSLDKRTYDESMIGIVGMSTNHSANVGITRQATLDMNISGSRGYVKDFKGNTENMNTAKVLTATESLVPFSTTHDDPTRVAMTFIQSSKHAVRTAEADPLLVTNGSDEALAYICSDQFAHKSKMKGTVKELNEEMMIVEYEDGTKEFIDLKEKIEKNSDGGFYVPLKLDPDPKLKIGSKIKPGQIIAYDKSSLSDNLGESDNLALNVGKLAKIAIINTDDGFEDSGIITESMAKKLACRIIGKVDCVLDKNTNVFNVASVGQTIEQGDTLLVWQTPYDEEEVNALLKALADDKEAVSELGKHTIKSEVTGRIAGMKVYRTVEDSELSDSLKSLVRKYEKPISELKKRLKDEGIETSDLPANYPLAPTGKLKNAADGILIEFYIEYVDTLGVGDKITYNAANKAVIKNVIPKGKEPHTDFRPNEEISAFVSVTSIQKRMVSSTMTYGALQKLMVELDRSCKDLAGIPYDDSEV